MCCSVVVGVMFKLNEFMGLHQDSQRDIFLKTADLQRENRSLTVKVKITIVQSRDQATPNAISVSNVS
jgi:hypothetical protein